MEITMLLTLYHPDEAPYVINITNEDCLALYNIVNQYYTNDINSFDKLTFQIPTWFPYNFPDYLAAKADNYRMPLDRRYINGCYYINTRYRSAAGFQDFKVYSIVDDTEYPNDLENVKTLNDEIYTILENDTLNMADVGNMIAKTERILRELREFGMKKFKQHYKKLSNNIIMATKIINFISGPSAGKTTMSALLFAEMKIAGYSVEYVQEYAKKLVWMEDYETLNNQYLVSKRQAELFEKICGKVDYIITDACLLHGLYYNRNNKDNVSNVEKVDELIWRKFRAFNNVNIFVERGDYPFELAGRIHSEQESKLIDKYLIELMEKNAIPFEKFRSAKESIPLIIEYVVDTRKNEYRS